MPQPGKGARLHLRKRAGRDPVFTIKDTGHAEISTGTGDRGQAEIALAHYISRKNRRSGPSEASAITIADILSIYGEEHAPTVAAPERLGYAIQALLPFWGGLTAADVKGETCRRYAKTRFRVIRGAKVPVAPGTIRRELNALGAAITYANKEGYLLTAPRVTLPAKPETNQRALTRDEVARLIRSARSRGQKHVARFVLISIYTGTRKVAALSLRLSGPSTVGGWFDLAAGVLYRRGTGERSTAKRRTPAKLPRQLLAHARRWAANGAVWAIEWRGQRVADVQTAWEGVVTDADIGWRPTPHTLKHTAITWAMQRGSSIPDAAGFFGTSAETIERVYWHHSPDFQKGAVSAIERRK